MASAGEAAFCQISIENDVRLDGRRCIDMRPLELELGVIAQAAGSARLRLGATDVVVGVKVEVGSVPSSAPNQGRLQVAVEFSPCASPIYKGRFGETYGEQIAAAIEASLAPSSRGGDGGKGGGRGGPPSGLDLTKLCIVTGKTAWKLHVDALVLNDDGNVMGAVSAATLAALQDTRIPKVEVVTDGAGEEEIELDDSPGAAWRLDVSGLPLVVTVSQVGSQCVVDLTAQEEPCAASALHVAGNGDVPWYGVYELHRDPLTVAREQRESSQPWGLRQGYFWQPVPPVLLKRQVNRQGQVCGITTSGRAGVEISMLLMMTETTQKLGPVLWDQLIQFLRNR